MDRARDALWLTVLVLDAIVVPRQVTAGSSGHEKANVEVDK